MSTIAISPYYMILSIFISG